MMAFSTEAEIAALCMNEREPVAIPNILETLGNKQQPTLLQTDSPKFGGVLNKKIQPKRTKATDISFHWLHNRQQQKCINIFWKPGIQNLGDYHTKHHPASHHQKMRTQYVT